MAVNPEYGEYIEIVRNEEHNGDCLSTQGNDSESSLRLNEPTAEEITNEPSQREENEEKKGTMRVHLKNKTGEEHSDNEEPPTSIPATASGENTVVIATGQHRGLMSDEFARNGMFYL
jgi:hypothetical protein